MPHGHHSPDTPPLRIYPPNGQRGILRAMNLPKPNPRTPAQAAAARLNGAISRGPKTPQGKSKSKLNALRHGFRSAAGVVLPHEDPGEIRAYREIVLRELECQGELEEEAGLRISALRWLVRRLDAVEERRLHAEVLQRLDDLPEKQHLDLVRGAIAAAHGMTQAMASRLPETREELDQLLVPIGAVVKMLSQVEDGGRDVFVGAGALGSAVETLKMMSDETVHVLAYGEVIERARQAGDALRALLPDVETKVESAKSALALEMPLPADRDVALRTRYRRSTEKALEAEVRFLTMLQERRTRATPGSFGSGNFDRQSPSPTLAHL